MVYIKQPKAILVVVIAGDALAETLSARLGCSTFPQLSRTIGYGN